MFGERIFLREIRQLIKRRGALPPSMASWWRCWLVAIAALLANECDGESESTCGLLPLLGFDILAIALDAAGLCDTLDSGGPVTVFAPMNPAFSTINAAIYGAAKGDTAELRKILLYHVVRGKYLSTDLVSGSLPTLLDGAEAIAVDAMTVDRVTVVQVDFEVNDATIHGIAGVLTPTLKNSTSRDAVSRNE